MDSDHTNRQADPVTTAVVHPVIESKSKTIAELFHRAVVQHHNKPALTDNDITLTYGKLDRQSNFIANRLTQASLNKGIVALVMERSGEMIVALFGIIKSGATYVIIDPAYPESRIAYMLDDTQCTSVITTSELSKKIPSGYKGEILLTEALFICPDEEHISPPVKIKPDALLYVIYTSGTTGLPKGVMAENRSVANMALSYIARFNVEPQDKFLQFASMSFAASVIEVFVALLSGACLVIVPEKSKFNHLQFSQFVKDRGISLALLPPNYVAELSPEDLPLRLLITAGSPTSWNIVDKWAKTVNYCNVYGCSETATGISAYFVGTERKTQNVPIGDPNTNTSYHLLDSREDPHNHCRIGELCVSGVCLARGYLNRPDLTALKFIEIADRQGSPLRLYRTGDLVRISKEGDIEIIGRVDEQININGYRIEPGEINACIAKFPKVRDSVVVAKQVRNKDSIVAYCVTDEKDIFMELRSFLRQMLPDYMLPQYVTTVGSIPLTINGKVDKSALPDPLRGLKTNKVKTSSRNDKEALLLHIWADILKIPPADLSTDDNYFYLGGDSITAIQIVSRLHEHGYLAEVHDLLFNPTINTFVKHVVRETGATISESIETVEPVDSRTEKYIVNRIRGLHESLHLQVPDGIKAQRRYPLSSMQSGLYLSYLTRRDSKYIVHNVFDLQGNLNLERFYQCLKKIIERHDVLRSVYTHFEAEQPYQIVMNECPLRLQFTDMSAVGYASAEEELKEWILRDREVPFDLEAENPIRFRMVKWSNEAFSLVMCYHHIIMDGWCLNIFWTELQQLYYIPASIDSVPILPSVPYANYINWLANLDKTAARDYWKSHLRDYHPISARQLKINETETASQYRVDHFYIEETSTNILKELAKQHQVTLSSILKTCWGLTLCSDKNARDVVFGEVLAGRPPHLSGSEHIMGLFVNTIPTRVLTEPSDTFISLTKRVQKTSFESMKHQYLPLAEIQSLSDCRGELLDHIFVYENYPPLTARQTGAKDAFEVKQTFDLDEVNYDLNVSVSVAKRVSVRMLYRDPTYSRQDIARLFDLYSKIISQISCFPGNNIEGYLETLGDTSRNATLVGEYVERPSGPIVDLIADRATVFANNIAIEQMPEVGARIPLFGGQINYAQLNIYVNQFANFLLSQHIESGDIIAVYLTRSTDYIVTVLGILKAGASYLPLDPANDESRIKAIVDMASPHLVVYDGNLPTMLAGCANTLSLSQALANIKTQSASDVKPTDRSDIAHILFTSGTTGRPKGVQVTHKGLINHALYVRDKLPLTRDDTVLQFSNLGFDTFSEEVFPTLLAGARLVLRNNDVLYSFDALTKSIVDYQITIVDLPTAYWNHWVDAITAMDVHIDKHLPLKKVIIGGESISTHHVKKWQSILPEVGIVNTYGPTEATVICSWYEVPKLDCNETRIPIGKPITNTQFHVLNTNLKPVTIGEPGQLFVAGDGVSKGYLQLPDRDGEAFIDGDAIGKPGCRLYATGDLVYIDGTELNVYYVGRADSLVKIRGYRVDLNDIKQTIENHHFVRLAHIDLLERLGDKKLVVYVQVENSVNRSSIRENITNDLPAEVGPINLHFVDTWPLNNNGKIDNQALAALFETSLSSGLSVGQTETEKALLRIWEEILGCSISDSGKSFFELGGHSLQAIAMLTKIHRQLGVKLSVDKLFKYSNIQLLAEQIDTAHTSIPDNGVILLAATDPGAQKIFFFPPVGGEVACYNPLAHRLKNDLAVYACKDIRKGSASRPASITELAEYYLNQIHKLQNRGPYLLAGWSMGGVLAQEVACLLESRGEIVRELFLIESWHPRILPKIDLSSEALTAAFVNDFILVNRSDSNGDYAKSECSNRHYANKDLRAIWKDLIDMGKLNREFDFTVFYQYFQAYRNNSLALRAHTPKHYESPTVLFQSTRATSDNHVPPKALGWSATISDLTVFKNNADHYSQLQGECLENIASHILGLEVPLAVN